MSSLDLCHDGSCVLNWPVCLLSLSPCDRATERRSKGGSPHQVAGLRPPRTATEDASVWHPGARRESPKRVALPAESDTPKTQEHRPGGGTRIVWEP